MMTLLRVAVSWYEMSIRFNGQSHLVTNKDQQISRADDGSSTESSLWGPFFISKFIELTITCRNRV